LAELPHLPGEEKMQAWDLNDYCERKRGQSPRGAPKFRSMHARA
jgi:hypothetical protein